MTWLAAVVTGGSEFVAPEPLEASRVRRLDGPWSQAAVVDLLKWFCDSGAAHLLWCLSPAPRMDPAGLDRMRRRAEEGGAAIVYGDYLEPDAGGRQSAHPLIDYQPGSLRDDFDFGPLVLLNGKLLPRTTERMERETPKLQHAGWYDLRLRLSEQGPVLRLPEPLYRVAPQDRRPGGDRPSGQRVFDYLDPRNREVQLEMERVMTMHIKRIGAFLPPPDNPPLPDDRPYPLMASVVIPVKDRAKTIAAAVGSALSQQTSFDFNVIVVDNHSTDGTGEILAEMAGRDRRLVHLVPERRDLLIGGCWNQAIFSPACGRYAVQLDSDDLYAGSGALERLVAELVRGPRALVIGSYTTVDFELRPLLPGLVDHREWTDENGHNNALRVAGLGAPRAFHVPTLRQFGFPDVSYGEDYAVALRLCRSWRVGRIFESLYWCRRWEENTDARLPLEIQNRHDAYKDRLRTEELLARQELNRRRSHP